jgi:hypothetical protein
VAPKLPSIWNGGWASNSWRRRRPRRDSSSRWCRRRCSSRDSSWNARSPSSRRGPLVDSSSPCSSRRLRRRGARATGAPRRTAPGRRR